MLSKDLEVTLNETFHAAKSKRHEFMTVEHLLLQLLDNSVALDVLEKVGADVDKLRSDLAEHVESTTPLIPIRWMTAALGALTVALLIIAMRAEPRISRSQ